MFVCRVLGILGLFQGVCLLCEGPRVCRFFVEAVSVLRGFERGIRVSGIFSSESGVKGVFV